MSASKTVTKKTTKVEAAAPVAAVAAPVVVAVAATATPKVTKKAAAAAAAPVVAAAPVAPAPVATAAVEAVAVDEDLGAVLQKSIAELQEQLSTLKGFYSAASAALKTIEKQAGRLAKRAERRRKRKTEAVAGAEPKPCIFTKPVKITDELCSFLGKPKGTEISRSAVTKGLMAYAKSNNLMDKQTIKADATLRKLLTLSETDVLTILNLQKYLGRHYVKPAPVAA